MTCIQNDIQLQLDCNPFTCTCVRRKIAKCGKYIQMVTRTTIISEKLFQLCSISVGVNARVVKKQKITQNCVTCKHQKQKYTIIPLFVFYHTVYI